MQIAQAGRSIFEPNHRKIPLVQHRRCIRGLSSYAVCAFRQIIQCFWTQHSLYMIWNASPILLRKVAVERQKAAAYNRLAFEVFDIRAYKVNKPILVLL